VDALLHHRTVLLQLLTQLLVSHLAHPRHLAVKIFLASTPPSATLDAAGWRAAGFLVDAPAGRASLLPTLLRGANSLLDSAFPAANISASSTSDGTGGGSFLGGKNLCNGTFGG
jgi:hypothetical protein